RPRSTGSPVGTRGRRGRRAPFVVVRPAGDRQDNAGLSVARTVAGAVRIRGVGGHGAAVVGGFALTGGALVTHPAVRCAAPHDIGGSTDRWRCGVGRSGGREPGTSRHLVFGRSRGVRLSAVGIFAHRTGGGGGADRAATRRGALSGKDPVGVGDEPVSLCTGT